MALTINERNAMADRIKETRKAMKKENPGKKYGQSAISKELDISPRAYANIENGDTAEIKLKHVLKLCEILECDITFLLGKHDEKSRDVADVEEKTGLSEKAVINLLKLNDEAFFSLNLDKSKFYAETTRGNDIIDALSLLLENDSSCEVLTNLSKYLFNDLEDAVVIVEKNIGETEYIDGKGMNDMYINRVIQGVRLLKDIFADSINNPPNIDIFNT